MKTMSTTELRKNLHAILTHVKGGDTIIAIGRRNNPEVLMMKYPTEYNPRVNAITNINAYSRSFDFLEDEPDIYSVEDAKKS